MEAEGVGKSKLIPQGNPVVPVVSWYDFVGVETEVQVYGHATPPSGNH